MKKLFFLFLLIPTLLSAQLNGSAILSGRVVGENQEGIPAASITLKGQPKGTISDSTGRFSLVINQKFPFRIIISSIGFADQEIEIKNLNSKLAIQLTSQTLYSNEVVVTASRTSEKILKSPVSVDKLD